MKKGCRLLIVCQVLLALLVVTSASAEESKVRPLDRPLRAVSLNSPLKVATAFTAPEFTPPASRASSTASGLMATKEVTKQRLELSPSWPAEGNYHYYTGWNPAYGAAVDKPGFFSLSQLYIFDRFVPIILFGAEWLRARFYYFQESLSHTGDAVGFRVGSGVGLGSQKNITFNLDVANFTPMGSSTGSVSGKKDNFSWGGFVGLTFYFN